MVLRVEEMEAGQIIPFTRYKNYEFVKLLNAGGTGKTILMRDPTINKLFVCKKYDPQQKEYEQEFYNRFIEEIKIMYSVYDNSIVRIYDYFLYPEYKTGYIIMEYINGDNIEEYFEIADEENINSVFVQIINAFSYLEQHNILHRDVRATNIMIDETGQVKIIDFGFGKKLNLKQEDNQASILLNWPVSKIPQEIYKEHYDIQTEIYYVGYLIKKIIEKYDIKCFKYGILLDKMIRINPNERIISFLQIQNCIADQTFEQINFTDREIEIYQDFAKYFCNMLYQINKNLNLERDIVVIIEKLRALLKDNSLEYNITNRERLISIFIKSKYIYYSENQMQVYKVKNFYDFFISQTDTVKMVVLNNLYGRIGNIPIIQDTYEELPFN